MIELSRVGVAYERTQILSDITGTFRPGEFTCVIGKNGSGKSTLLRAMAGLIPYEGKIVLNGREVAALPKKERARRLSYLPQIRSIPAMEVGTLIAHGRYPHLGFSKTLTGRDWESIEDAASVTGVTELLDRPVATLSGGERQRAYIAMAVAQDAELMLLDEPTAYLDMEHQLEVMELLARLHRGGKGIVMAAHDLPQAFSYADRALLLGGGSVVAHGSPDALCASEAIRDTFGISLRKSTGDDEFYAYRLVKGGARDGSS